MNIQDKLLNQIRKDGTSVTIFFINGYPLKGRITGFDKFSIRLKNNEKEQMLLKGAVSTIQLEEPIQLFEKESNDTNTGNVM